MVVIIHKKVVIKYVKGSYYPSSSSFEQIILLLCWVCREFNQNPNLWEIKQIEKTQAKEKKQSYA